MKTASDLDVPMVGIGLLYQEGYFRQILDRGGRQIEAFPYNDPISLPISPVMPPNREWLRVPLELPGRTVLFRVWHVQVGRVNLFLLDSNSPLNSSADRGITSKLYDDRSEMRLLQEMAQGIAGWRILEALGIEAEICHLNEGHAAFAVLERARCFMQKTACSFAEALWATRAGNVFTTHTPVAAAFDSFAPEMIERNCRDYVRRLGLSMEEFLSLGRQQSAGADAPFTMAILAMRGCLHANGVSRLHGIVSRRLFQPLFPRWPEHEVSVGSITNGVHVPSWDSEWADALWTKAGGKGRWLGGLEILPKAIRGVSDRDLWTFRCRGREALVNYARQRLIHQYRLLGIDPDSEQAILQALDPRALTLGFARRFTAYKRPTLLLHDPERLARLLTDSQRPVQLIVAGKAHPRDEEGKRLVQQFVAFARWPKVRQRVVFLQDYDMALAQQPVQGVDVWINTPKRPWEACGTSGMKVLVNGGLNLSELDGWWDEAYAVDVGWRLGDGREHDDPGWDAVEAQQLYDVLEQQVVPEFYSRNAEDIPVLWVERIRESMARLTPRYSSHRMLREYVDLIYLPATARFRKRTAEGSKLAQELLAWHDTLNRYWASVRFGAMRVKRGGNLWHFAVSVYLGELDPRSVRVELYADPVEGHGAVREPLATSEVGGGSPGWYQYHGAIEAARPAEHFTPRLIPLHPEAGIPQEVQHILWLR